MERGSNAVRAIVRDIDGEMAWVEPEQGGCGRCHEEGGCGGQNLTQVFCSSPKVYRVANAVGAVPGDRVLVAIADGGIRRSANLAYGLPLLAVLAGGVLGQLGGGDLGAIFGALAGLLGALGFLRWRTAGKSGLVARQPEIVARC